MQKVLLDIYYNLVIIGVLILYENVMLSSPNHNNYRFVI